MELPAWLNEALQLAGVALSVVLVYAVQEIRKRFQKQLDRTETTINAVAQTATSTQTKVDQVAVVTNGRLEKALADLAEMRDEAQKWRLMAERWCQIVRELNSTPQGRAVIDEVMQKNRSLVHDSSFDELLARMMHIKPPPGGSYD